MLAQAVSRAASQGTVPERAYTDGDRNLVRSDALAFLSDQGSVLRLYFRARQAAADRGHLLQKIADAALVEGVTRYEDLVGMLDDEMGSCREVTDAGTPVPWECDRSDVLVRIPPLLALSTASMATKCKPDIEVSLDGIVGHPDYVCEWDGRPAALELKSGVFNFPDSLQAQSYAHMLSELSGHAHTAVLAYVNKEGLRVLEWDEEECATGFKFLSGTLLPAYRTATAGLSGWPDNSLRMTMADATTVFAQGRR